MINSLSSPDTAFPIENQLDYTVTVAGQKIDAKKACLEFRNRDVFGRGDVRSYITSNVKDISGLQELKNAIANKHPNKVDRKMDDVADEMIDNLVDRSLLKFPCVELSQDFEFTLIKEWANRCQK